ncbi:WD repeat-containing protein 44 [Echinococcus granulosus]|uniref:WD repeat-containing protein 44 n=1 Tax=Echinococcus granulosus TaxID=6210 RepID=W6UFF3_ECHGR|nr:WD repeat-containing protein 44 [Echinococcus granulosus]EUB59606.1 WD repeat-containing protein 44 [Echinococcus granulosus]
MAHRGDRKFLVDSPPPPPNLRDLRNSPSHSGTHKSHNHVPNDTTKKWFCRGPSSTSKQLSLIYVSIAACLAAISVALLITIFFGRPQVTPHGFLMSEFGPCSKAGKQIMMRRGGNAVDALVSIVLCLTVTRPDIISLGGCGAFWVHKRDTDSNDLFDAMCTSPNTTDQANSNVAHDVSIPGLIAGLKALHNAHGYLYWAELFHPAIEVAHNGFPVHPDLLKNLVKVASDASLAPFAQHFLKSVQNGSYGPQPVLEATLRQLATKGTLVFYNGSIGQSIVAELQKHNVSWQMESNLGAYQVQRPNYIELSLAGFIVRSFPSPFAGGILTTTVLANLDILNHQRPLNARKLAWGEASELALIYHRLIELTKLGVKQVSLLGDPYNPTTGKKVVDQEKNILSIESRKKAANMVRDDRLVDSSEYGGVDPILFTAQDTNTFVLSVESDMLISAASLTLGGTFGSGIVVSGTGILLNSAQRLFSSVGQGGVNSRAPGHRPLLPFSPVFFETAQQKCGHRFVVASSGGIQGMIGLSQVLTSSFLYLSNVACTGDGYGLSSGEGGNELPSAEETTATYTPAVGGCLPLNDSLNLKRFVLRLQHTSNGGDEFHVLLEPGFNSAVGEELKKLGHNVENAVDGDFRADVGAVGWTLYTTIGGVDESAVNVYYGFEEGSRRYISRNGKTLKKTMKARKAYLEQRRKQLLEDNIKEDKTIKRLTKKLGLNRRKPRKSGVEKQPAWMRDSGLDYLLDFEKHNSSPAKEVLGSGILGEPRTKLRRKESRDIYGQDVDDSDGSTEADAPIEPEEKVFDFGKAGGEDKEVNEIVDINGGTKLKKDTKIEEKENKIAQITPSGDEETIVMLRRSIRRLLNCVSEAQMTKTISELADLFSDRPCATVRRVLIEEIDILLGSFPLNRDQSVGWLQQELAACFTSTQARLDHSGQDSRLVVHFAEFFVSSRLPTVVTLDSLQDSGGALASRCLFIAYLYRFGGLTGDLIMDCVEEFTKSGDLLGLQIAHQMVKPVSSVLRRELHERCSQLVNAVKATLATLDPSDFEKTGSGEATLAAVATRLGLITPIRQQLFRVLVSTPGGPESTASALVLAAGTSGGGGRATEHREREMVQIVMHCLVSEQPFNRFYTRVLGALLNHHRRFAIMVRCAFWDVMAKEEMTKESKTNAGKAIGILAAVYDFPLTMLKKFNFGDDSEPNVALLSAVVTELTTTAFRKTLEKFAYVASKSPKLGRNLRIFMRRLCKSHPDEAHRAGVSSPTMSSDDEVYFDAPEELSEEDIAAANSSSTPEHECRRNRIESLKNSARKFDRPSHIPPYSHLDAIESASAVAPILDSDPFSPVPPSMASSRLHSRTFPEKSSFFPGKGAHHFLFFTNKHSPPPLLGFQRSHFPFNDDFENCSKVRSHTVQPICFSPVLASFPFERPAPISAPEVSLCRHRPNKGDYMKSWSLDATRCRPQLLLNYHRRSLLASSLVPLPMEPLLDHSEGSEIDAPPHNQSQMDACVQANIGTVAHQGITATTDDTLLPAHEAPAMLRAKAAAATLPGSSVNPMSLDYRTRTLSTSSLRNSGDLEKLDSEHSGSHRNPNFLSGFRRLHTAFRGAVNAVRSATKAKNEASSEEDDEVIGNQGIRLRCSRKIKGHKEFLQIKLVQKMDNEHIGAIWAMRSSPCGRLLATAGYDRNIRIWVLRQWYNHFRNMLQERASQMQQGDEASPGLDSTMTDDLDIDSVSMTSVSFSTSRTDDGGSSCSSSGLLETSSVSTRSRGEVSPSDLLMLNSQSRCSSSSAYYHPQPLLVYRGHESVITELAWSKNLFLLSTGMDRQVRLWHVSRQECLCAFSHNDTVPAIVFHPKDDRYFLSGSLDGKLRLWNIPDKKVRFWVDVPLPSCLPSPSSPAATVGGGGAEPKTIITCATFACDSTKVVVGSYDGRVMFFNTEILVTSNDSRVRLIDARDYHTLCKYRGFLNETSQIRASFSATGRYLISGSENCFFYIWRKQMDFLNVSRFSSTRKDRNNCWEAIKAHDAVVTVAIFLPNPDLLLDRRLRRNSARRRTGTDHAMRMKMSSKVATYWGEVIVSADCNGCIRVFKNRAPFIAAASSAHTDS